MLDPTLLPDSSYSRPPYLEHLPDRPPWSPLPPDPFRGRKVYEQVQQDPTPLIVVTGMLTDGQVDVRHVVRLETAARTFGVPLRGAAVELLDEQDGLLSRAALHIARTTACGCGCRGHGRRGEPPASGLVQALVPDLGAGHRLRIVHDEEEIWSRGGGEGDGPSIDGLRADCDEEEMRLHWEEHIDDRGSGEDEGGIVRIAQWSADEGRTWSVLGVGFGPDRAELPASLPSGHHVVRVVVSDGFRTGRSEPVPVDVPRRAPDVTILWPTDHSVVELDAPLQLWCAATGSDGRQLDDELLRWELDGQPVGRGREVWAHLADWQGEHRCTLHADDGGRRVVVQTTFIATFDGREIVGCP
jgi:hypothetical protein